MIVIIIFVIFVATFLLAPWVVYLMGNYIVWVDDVIDKIREKKYETKMKIGNKNEK